MKDAIMIRCLDLLRASKWYLFFCLEKLEPPMAAYETQLT